VCVCLYTDCKSESQSQSMSVCEIIASLVLGNFPLFTQEPQLPNCCTPSTQTENSPHNNTIFNTASQSQSKPIQSNAAPLSSALSPKSSSSKSKVPPVWAHLWLTNNNNSNRHELLLLFYFSFSFYFISFYSILFHSNSCSSSAGLFLSLPLAFPLLWARPKLQTGTQLCQTRLQSCPNVASFSVPNFAADTGAIWRIFSPKFSSNRTHFLAQKRPPERPFSASNLPKSNLLQANLSPTEFALSKLHSTRRSSPYTLSVGSLTLRHNFGPLTQICTARKSAFMECTVPVGVSGE